MTKNNYCTLSTTCSGECPPDISCPLDRNDLSQKDRSKSRSRHLNEQKAKQSAQKALEIIYAKAEKIDAEDNDPERSRILDKKYANTLKKVHPKPKVDEEEVHVPEAESDTEE